MRLQFALFCESAKVTPDGFIYILAGGFDFITTTCVPATMEQAFLVSRFLLDPEECERDHRITLRAFGPGLQILTWPNVQQIAFRVRRHPIHPDAPNTMTVSINLSGIEFPVPGDYSFRFFLENSTDKPIGETKLAVQLSPAV